MDRARETTSALFLRQRIPQLIRCGSRPTQAGQRSGRVERRIQKTHGEKDSEDGVLPLQTGSATQNCVAILETAGESDFGQASGDGVDTSEDKDDSSREIRSMNNRKSAAELAALKTLGFDLNFSRSSIERRIKNHGELSSTDLGKYGLEEKVHGKSSCISRMPQGTKFWTGASGATQTAGCGRKMGLSMRKPGMQVSKTSKGPSSEHLEEPLSPPERGPALKNHFSPPERDGQWTRSHSKVN